LTIISATADCHFWPIARHNMHVISYLWHYGYEMINVSDRAPGIIRNKQHIPRHRKVILYMSSSSSGGISVFADMHCVTRWSRFDNHWEGLLTTELMKRVKLRPQARHVMVHAENNYTANLPILDFLRPTTIFALRHDGEPLTAEHGYPVRLVVPHLYAWKSVKWVRGIELLDRELPGLWEFNGYHIYGDPVQRATTFELNVGTLEI
jgi:hypothetical protein